MARQIRFLSSVCCPSCALPTAMLLVCEACPVSVSVRPARLGVSGTTRDSGHHSRFVPFALLLATAARGLGVDEAFLLGAIHRVEPLPEARGERGLRARSNDVHIRTGRWTNRIARLYDLRCARELITYTHHVRSTLELIDATSIARIVTTGWRRGSDDAIGAVSLARKNTELGAANRIESFDADHFS